MIPGMLKPPWHFLFDNAVTQAQAQNLFLPRITICPPCNRLVLHYAPGRSERPDPTAMHFALGADAEKAQQRLPSSGVYFRDGAWNAAIQHDGKIAHLGQFPSAEAAAHAWDLAARAACEPADAASLQSPTAAAMREVASRQSVGSNAGNVDDVQVLLEQSRILAKVAQMEMDRTRLVQEAGAREAQQGDHEQQQAASESVQRKYDAASLSEVSDERMKE